MSKRFVIIVGLLLVVAVPASVMAGGHEAKIKKYVKNNVSAWIFAPELLAAVAQQNINHMGLTGDDIHNLDQRWRTEKKYHGGGDLMDSKMNNQLSAFLRGVKAASGGVIVEIFVMDNLGLNVGQTDPTGDYMQGDEAKWKKTYLVSAKAIFIDEVEEDGGMNICQTSLTVARPNGARLGAVTIAFNVDKL